MKNLNLKKLIPYLMVLLMLPVLNINLYSRHGNDEGGNRHNKNGDGKDTNSFVVSGMISAITLNTFSIDSIVIYVDSTTKIEKEHVGLIDLNSLNIGDFVIAKGTKDSNIYLAKAVEVKDSNHNTITDFDLRGVIASINSNTITVDNDSFIVDSNTIIRMDDMGMLHLSDLTTGMNIDVHGVINQSIKYARSILVKSWISDSLEIKGRITSILDSTFTVNNTVINVIPVTKILDYNNNPIQLSDLTFGNFVEVQLNIINNTNYALIVHVKDKNNSNDGNDTCAIDMVYNDHFTANNINFDIDANTQIFDKMGNHIAYNDLKSGMKVIIYEDVKNNLLYAGKINVVAPIVADVNTSNDASIVQINNEPNPFSDVTTLKLNLPTDGLIACELFNQVGQKVIDIYNGYAGSGETNFIIDNTVGLTPGVYYFTLMYNGKLYVRTIVKS